VRGVWGKYHFPTTQRFEHCPTPGAKQDKTRAIPGFIFVIAFERVGFEPREGVGKQEFPVVEVLEPSGSKE